MSSEAGVDGKDGQVFAQVRQALELVHNPASSNDARRQAQDFLEQVKGSAEAPIHGHTLASDRSQPHIVRHYGLFLLDHAIRYQWSTYGQGQIEAIVSWVIGLGQAISRDDPPFIRNKTAQLWIEVAKRAWGDEWMDMDSRLVELWSVPDSSVHKEFVLAVLEALSDEVFAGEDSVVGMREGVLSKACVEVFTPAAVLLEVFPNRQAGPDVRNGHEGWLVRVTQFLSLCINSGAKDNQEVRSCAIKALATLQSQMPWAIPTAVAASDCVSVLCSSLAFPSPEVQKGALECLHALYSRSNFNDKEFNQLVVPMYRQQPVQLCKDLFDWCAVDPEAIDDDKYLVLKKLSETLSSLGDYLCYKFKQLPQDVSADPFLHLMVHVVQHQSLMVSIPAVVTWSKLLHDKALQPGERFRDMIGPLLEVSISRLVRYEHLPEESEDPCVLFLMEDTDTMPERHAFLGNYRRYTAQVIEAIVQLELFKAVTHILSSTEGVLQNLYEGGQGLDKQNYSKYSMPALRVDCSFTVIEAMLRGYVRWRSAHPEDSSSDSLESELESWCNKLLEMTFDDPVIRKRKLQLLVYFSTTALNSRSGFMLKVLEHILVTWPDLEPEYRAYNDAIRDLQSESMVELQRLASEMPDHLLDVYDQIAGRVNEMLSSGTLDEKRSISYRSFLFIIIHRASKIDEPTKIPKLREFVDPVKAQWHTDSIESSLKSYSGFCELLGLDKAQAYLAKHRAHEIQDWGSYQLDAEGLAIQEELDQRLKALPLRSTKSFLAFSVERLSRSSPAFQVSHAIWQDGFNSILVELLQFLSYAHASHNPDAWTGLPAEMRQVVHRVLSDRFWQSGISEGSKDEFYARVVDKKATIEGFASSVRGSVRFVRETAYSIIYCMSRLDSQFYGNGELSGPLAMALFTDSAWLSTHQQSNLLNLVRYLVDDCPVDCRETFLPQLLAACFRQMDTKISTEWGRIEEQQGVSVEGDAALKEEMKAESILRQVTYTAVLMVADFLDPGKKNSRCLDPGPEHSRIFPSLRKFCLMNQEIVEPLLVFCCHGIRVRDTRSCNMVLRMFVSLVPEFGLEPPGSKKSQPLPLFGREPAERTLQDSSPVPPETAAVIREYMSTEVLRACITSFHEPYFVDLQKELASLIAAILVYYMPVTSTPRDVLLSLPNVNPADLERLGAYTAKPGSQTRQQRAVVLDMLKDLKGVSVSEMGKMPRSAGFGDGGASSKKPQRSKMAQAFMMVPEQQPRGVNGGGERGGTPDALDGVANLFDS